MHNAMYVEYKEKLIDLVKMNPGLYRESRKAPGLKQIIWDEIGAELGTTGHNARRQWEVLRDQQRRENKRLKQNPNYKSKWMFYNRMLFTYSENTSTFPASAASTPRTSKAAVAAGACSDDPDYYRDFKNENNYLQPKAEEGESIIQVRRDLQESNDSSILQSGCSSAPLMTTTTSTPPLMPKVDDYHPLTNAGVSSSTQLHRYNDDVNSAENTCWRNKRHSDYREEDEDYYFAMSIVPSLRCIPRAKKLRLQSKIMNLIAAAVEEEAYVVDCHSSASVREVEEDIDITIENKFIPTEMLQAEMND